jgi:uncharacterized membrane protein YgcG
MPNWPMTRRRLLRQIDCAQVENSIRQAERGSSGEIRVSITGFFRGSLRDLGERAFRKLGMTATVRRNGVLILIAPTRRQVVILGDAGIHAHVGEAFWSALAEDLSQAFRQRDFTGGLDRAIARIGQELALHFPPDPRGDTNELPNAVDV